MGRHRNHRRAGGVEAALKFQGEHQVRQLALAVCRPRPIGALLTTEVGQVQPPYPMHLRGQRDDAILDLGEQKVGEQEMAQDIGGELQFIALRRAATRHGHDAGIVDQHLDRPTSQLRCRGAHGCQVREV